MSYDFEIATRDKPGPLEPLLERLGIEARLEGAFEPERNVLVTRTREPHRTIDAEGPAGYDPIDLAGDLNASFAAAAPGARWLSAIHLPGGYAEPDDRWVLDLAIGIAREHHGAVWDPQSERVLWPENPPAGRGRRRASEHRSGTHKIVVAWHVPQVRLTSDAPTTLLALLRTHLPDGLPNRFGQTDPYEHRLERDGDGAFVGDWSAEAERQSLLTWDGATRGWSGMALFRRGDGVRLEPDAVVEVRGEGAAALDDRAAAAGLVEGLVAIADTLDAVYARAHVEPVEPAFIRGGVPVAPFRDVRAHGWAGIPRDPSWLAWFGRPYADRLRADLADRIDRDTVHGFLLRARALPAMPADLRPLFPDLPQELIQEEWFVESPTDGTPIARLRPAPEIPALDAS
ncbi:MAG: hypothetical protein ACJ77F_08910 [Chloroflexota bacterium]